MITNPIQIVKIKDLPTGFYIIAIDNNGLNEIFNLIVQ